MDDLYWWLGAIVFWSVFPLAALALIVGVWVVAANIIFRKGRHAGRFAMYLLRRGYVREDGLARSLALQWEREPDKAPRRL